MPVCRYVEENSLAALLAAKRSAGVAPEVNVREHGFGTRRRRHQKSQTGVSVAPQKGLMSYKKFKKRKRNDNLECSLADEHTQR